MDAFDDHPEHREDFDFENYLDHESKDPAFLIEDYDWDDDKNSENLAKHGVSFEEAASCFRPDANIWPASANKSGESRWILRGSSYLGRPLTVFFTMRGRVARIFSAR